MAFATPEDVATRLGRELNATEAATVEDLLDSATGLVQAEARQTIELVEDDVLTIRGSRETAILLPERPVVSVTSVTVNGVVDPAEVWHIDGDRLIRRRGWNGAGDVLVIVYTHGYDPIPGAIRAVVIGAVVRAITNPGNVMSERLGQAQITYAAQGTPTGVLLTTDERRTVRRVVSRGAEALPIR